MLEEQRGEPFSESIVSKGEEWYQIKSGREIGTKSLWGKGYHAST